MPAFSYFTATYITGSSFIKSLRSRLLPTSRNSSKNSKAVSNEHDPEIVTFGGGGPRRKNYFELTDSMLLKTDATSTTVHGDEEAQQVRPPASHTGMEHAE